MTTLRVNTPFGTRLFPTDLLFKNFFDQASTFETNLDKKINHPVDIMYTEEALIFEIAAVGLNKKDIDLSTEDGTTLKVSYTKPNIESNDSNKDAGEYIHKGIATRKFKKQFDLAEHIRVEHVSITDGILSVFLQKEVPEELQPKKFTILQAAPGDPEFLAE